MTADEVMKMVNDLLQVHTTADYEARCESVQRSTQDPLVWKAYVQHFPVGSEQPIDGPAVLYFDERVRALTDGPR